MHDRVLSHSQRIPKRTTSGNARRQRQDGQSLKHKVATVLRGRQAGKKVVVIKLAAAGIERYPRDVLETPGLRLDGYYYAEHGYGGLFGNTNTGQTTNRGVFGGGGGGGLFGNTANHQQQPATSGGLFGGTITTQRLATGDGSFTTNAGGNFFGSTTSAQQPAAAHAIQNSTRLLHASAKQTQIVHRLLAFVQHLQTLIPSVRSSAIRPEEEEMRGTLEEIEDKVKKGRVKGRLNELWAIFSEQQAGLAHRTKILQKCQRDLAVIIGTAAPGGGGGGAGDVYAECAFPRPSSERVSSSEVEHFSCSRSI
ncbi:uncharacterized protein LACBIDRAFT_325438 [Laccaria bicolor S238N-H82]|uniref:Predicted protein n=1 Tax=Laccaria bicolor (strain S238N-H82 / ATCC MYA-4686) TaxID=486041 RepID=B0D4X8_LACBS|nr:uncharacterized protein LACBIDRAFT_325438 [Laccaria bicolor S238N-H82]EDR10643.1 predicted protein [Laccaria bicolor S238N-H82]|eukprot:XP_001879093.1 predicted protein [Laccaria bicolor S238N-H82]